MALENLKAAGKAILNSPKAIRKKLGHTEEPHHDKLDEDWYHSDDPINAGISFYVKYLGSTEVTKTHGPGSTDDAVKSIVQHVKHSGNKLQKVQITISSRTVRIQDVGTQVKLEEIPLYRVSYCTVDPYYDKVFCYISRNHENKKLECHAFLCSKKSKAEAITLTVAQAFNIAYERWQAQKKKRAERKKQSSLTTSAKGKPAQAVSNGGVPHQPKAESLIGEEITKAPSDRSSPQAQPKPSEVPIPVLAPPPSVVEPAQVPSQGVQKAKVTLVPMEKPSQVSTNPFSRDDTHIRRGSGLLDVKTTMTKAVSLDYLRIEDELDMEFTQLAEARSNPHLLDIGSHMNRTTSKEEVSDFMKTGEKPSDLSKSKSIDDLLFL